MIQDIEPHVMDNQYHPRDPKPGDFFMFYAQGSALINPETGLPFTYEEVTALISLKEHEVDYLLKIDDVAFFRVSPAPAEIVAVGRPEKDFYFRNLPDEQRWIAHGAVTSGHLNRWYNGQKFCGRCGHPMKKDAVERAMRCPDCNNLVYPIICPSVIVAVTHKDRILLTKYSPIHRPGLTRNYALIAGYAEIGESLEHCVHREVLEEVGLKVKNLRFYKSQPWGFSGSLLSGFYCDLDGDDENVTLDVEELSEGTWFSREELPEAGGSGAISLTHEMVEHFREGPV